MPGLGETTAMLARLRRRNPVASPARPSFGRLVEATPPRSNPGALRMLYYAPAELPAGAPLVVVLHGCTQTADAYAVGAGWLELADRLGFAVLAPEQTSANNINRCFNWFADGDIQRGQGEAASIAQMVLAMVKTHRLDPDRVFVTGLSAGGAMTAVMLATYPDLFAGGAVIAGLPYGVAHGVPDAMRAMYSGTGSGAEQLGALVRKAAQARSKPVRISIWHGDADTTVTPGNADALVAQWTSAYGLSAEPRSVHRLNRRTRSRWEAAAPDGAVVELNIMHGLGHGTPLSTRDAEGIGSPGPFMLEAGVSSTLEIADFWGLRSAVPKDVAEPEHIEARPPQPASIPYPGPSPRSGPAATVMEAIEGRVPAEVKAIIAKALRSAGLGQ